MLNLPLWQRVLVQISKGKNNICVWGSSYSKEILKGLETEGLIEIDKNGKITLSADASKIAEGVSYGLFEEI